MNIQEETSRGMPRPVLPPISARSVWISPSNRYVLWEGWESNASTVKNSSLLHGGQISPDKNRILREKTIKVPAYGDFLVSWAPVNESALFVRNGGEFNSKADLYYVVDPDTGTSANMKVRDGFAPFAAFWSRTGQEILCIAKGNGRQSVATKENWIFLKFQVRHESKHSIQVSPEKIITSSEMTKYVGSSLLPALRAAKTIESAYGSALCVSLSPSRKSAVVIGDSVRRNVPQWADPDYTAVYFATNGRVIRREIDSRINNGMTSTPVWSKDERTVYFLTQEYLISLSKEKGGRTFYDRSDALKGVLQIMPNAPK